MARKKLAGHDRAFLDAIAADPEDDAPRLVYADWLDDNGQAHRAELIRLQCRLAKMEAWDPDRLALEQREADLLLVHDDEWRKALPAWTNAHRQHIRRGFVDQLGVTVTDFLKRGVGLLAAAPVSEFRPR